MYKKKEVLEKFIKTGVCTGFACNKCPYNEEGNCFLHASLIRIGAMAILRQNRHRKEPRVFDVNKQLKQENKRAKVLLKATLDLLQKQKESHYVLNLLENTVFYDEAECDGYCLFDDIEIFLNNEG